VPVRLITAGWPPPGWFAVACDVGQGDALVLAAGPHSAVVVDAGPDPTGVDGCLRRLGVDAVPLLVISHFHVDHVGGVEGVFRGRTVGRVLISPHPEPAAGRAGVVRLAAAHGVPVEEAAVGSAYAVGAVLLTVLGPTHEMSGTRSDPNNNSVIARVAVAGHTMLLTGDAEDEQQRSLVETVEPAALHAEILKVAHHGSAFQDPQFLGAVAPAVALVSVGAGNDYGHPSPVVLARLGRDGARVLRTDEAGDLAVTDDAGRLSAVTHGIEPGRRRRRGPPAEPGRRRRRGERR